MPDDPKPLFVFDEADGLPDGLFNLAGDFAQRVIRVSSWQSTATNASPWSTTTAAADITVEKLTELMRSIPPAPPLPQTYRDGDGVAFAVLERFDGPLDREVAVVRVRDSGVGVRLEREAAERGHRVAWHVGEMPD